jgi:hypothetical protein
MKIETKYKITDRVWISELRCPATILTIYISEIGIQYNLRWFSSQDAKTAYFFESEITDLPENEKLGFEPPTKK